MKDMYHAIIKIKELLNINLTSKEISFLRAVKILKEEKTNLQNAKRDMNITLNELNKAYNFNLPLLKEI